MENLRENKKPIVFLIVAILTGIIDIFLGIGILVGGFMYYMMEDYI